MDNLQALCRGCHIKKTAGENQRELTPAELRWREAAGGNAGAPILE